MEEREDLGGHKDLYKDVMMEDEPDGSRKRNPPQRCPRPLEDLPIPRHDQSANLKEEIKEEEDEDGVMEESSSYRNPPQRCPRPLKDIPRHDQVEDLMKIKVEGEGGETYVRDDQRSTEEVGGRLKEEEETTRTLKEEAWMMRTIKEEDAPPEISTGLDMEEPSKDRLTLSPGCKMEDEDVTADCAGKETTSSDMDDEFFKIERPRPIKDDAGIQEETYSCPECGKGFSSQSTLCVHLSSHMGDKFLYCYECGKCFLRKEELVSHYRTHTGEKPYSCQECGKSFSEKRTLIHHHRVHTGWKPYSCSDCGRCFARWYSLNAHRRVHTGEKPYSCPQCGKCFKQKSYVRIHQGSHTGEKPYSCSECGKCFLHKAALLKHYKSHLKRKPHPQE